MGAGNGTHGFTTMSIDFSRHKVIDYETTGLNPFGGARVFAYCIGHHDGHVDRYRLDTSNKTANRDNRKRLVDFWQDTSLVKVAHNIKYEIEMTMAEGIRIPKTTVMHDTMIQSQVLRNLAPSHKLSVLAWELRDPERYHFGNRTFNSKELDQFVHAEGKRLGGFDKIDDRLMEVYQVADGQRPMLLHRLWLPILYAREQVYSDYQNEIALIRATADMESYGIAIDPDACRDLVRWLEDSLDNVQQQTYKLLGRFVNLGSPSQLIRLLYGELGFPIYEFTKSKQPSVDKEVVTQLRNDFPTHEMVGVLDLVLQHRSYTKGLANIQSYLEFADANNIIHPNIGTNRAKTGREGCSNPNLQNVEKDRESEKNPYPVPARQCFVSRVDHLMYFPDYSGIELRLIIEAAQCVKMMQLLKSGRHPHVVFCEMFYGDLWVSKKVTPAVYDHGKNGHFCLCYGGSKSKLAATLGLTPEYIVPGLSQYTAEFPEIRYLVRDGISKVSKIGYVETPFGRVLWLEPDKIYGWLNYFIQGTAAGILKRAQVKIHEYLSTVWAGSGIALVLPIHDELVISYPRAMLRYRDEILGHISWLMTDMPEIKVALEVEWKGTTWSWDKAKEFQVAAPLQRNWMLNSERSNPRKLISLM